MKNTFLISVLLLSTALRADVPGLKIGLITKAEWNTASGMGNESSRLNFQNHIESANGLYLFKGLSRRFAVNASVLLGRARYDLNYTQAGSTFLDADIHFTQTNLNLEFLLNPDANAVWYLFGGVQHLYRRWGEERYVNSVISNTYWPSSSLQAQAGLGVHIKATESVEINVFAGLRNGFNHSVMYESSLNQIFSGIALTLNLEGKQKNKFGNCPTEF